MDETTGMHLFQIVMRIEQALRNVEGLRCEGTNILQNNNAAAGQDVPHVHIHIVPRFADDGNKLHFKTGPTPDREALDALADTIEMAM
jgi:histidine triad (HIT) family protein